MEIDCSLNLDSHQYALTNKIPLVDNCGNLRIISEHKGLIFFSRWNPLQMMLATGGHGDNFVDVWDYNLISKAKFSTSNVNPKPLIQLQHIDL